jgi:2-alkenal reductase
MTAMVAKYLGAGRVVGSTRSQRKAEQLRGLGYDALIVHSAAASPEHALGQLKAAAPDGLDVAIDNVGGELLRAALFTARRGARLIVLGALAGQLAPEGTGRAAPVTLDSFPILLRGVTIRGYSADDDADARLEWYRLFGEGLRSGAMTFPHVMLHGIQSAPEAIQAAAEGAHLGTIIVAL